MKGSEIGGGTYDQAGAVFNYYPAEIFPVNLPIPRDDSPQVYLVPRKQDPHQRRLARSG